MLTSVFSVYSWSSLSKIYIWKLQQHVCERCHFYQVCTDVVNAFGMCGIDVYYVTSQTFVDLHW